MWGTLHVIRPIELKHAGTLALGYPRPGGHHDVDASTYCTSRRSPHAAWRHVETDVVEQPSYASKGSVGQALDLASNRDWKLLPPSAGSSCGAPVGYEVGSFDVPLGTAMLLSERSQVVHPRLGLFERGEVSPTLRDCRVDDVVTRFRRSP